MVFSLPL